MRKQNLGEAVPVFVKPGNISRGLTICSSCFSRASGLSLVETEELRDQEQ